MKTEQLKQKLVDTVIEEIKNDLTTSLDVTAIDEMFILLLKNPDNVKTIIAFLPEEKGKQFEKLL